jgi:phosphoribosylaminoimidazole-succinocarboxamide synthase
MSDTASDARLVKKGKARQFWIYNEKEPSDTALGLGYQFWAADNYSLFDKGTFPQQIPGKAENNYKTGVNFFKLLSLAGIDHHMTRDLGNRKMEVQAARIPPNYGWITRGETVVYLVPMEVIFSKIVTPVASLYGRLMRGEEDPLDYGLDGLPEKGQVIELMEPKLSPSTKIDAVDRYQTEVDTPIHELAGLLDEENDRIEQITLDVFEIMRRDAEKTGLLTVADGKIEFIMGPNRELIVADTGYSWDENRLLYYFPEGSFVDVSKEFARDVYAIMGYKGEIKKAKDRHPKEKSKWPEPPFLDEKQIGIMVDANEAVRKVILKESGADTAIKDVAYRTKDELERLKDQFKRDETGADI